MIQRDVDPIKEDKHKTNPPREKVQILAELQVWGKRRSQGLLAFNTLAQNIWPFTEWNVYFNADWTGMLAEKNSVTMEEPLNQAVLAVFDKSNNE